ncbi:MAG TPA: hypothetical protein VHP99_14525, partial [Pyrinomonadaceae bacterium]|nr:hypothetical protein [Pyrinomonadaceae bacterium]
NDTPDFWAGIEAEWRRNQKPDFAPLQSEANWPTAAKEWLEKQRRKGLRCSTISMNLPSVEMPLKSTTPGPSISR